MRMFTVRLISGFRMNGNIATFLLLILVVKAMCEACYSGWEEHQGFCYKIYTKAANFENAENTCMANGGHLVSIHTQDEEVFVVKLLMLPALNGTLWLGLKWLPTGLNWTDGTDYGDYRILNLENPHDEGECVIMQNVEGWLPEFCFKSNGFMCKRKAGDNITATTQEDATQNSATDTTTGPILSTTQEDATQNSATEAATDPNLPTRPKAVTQNDLTETTTGPILSTTQEDATQNSATDTTTDPNLPTRPKAVTQNDLTETTTDPVQATTQEDATQSSATETATDPTPVTTPKGATQNDLTETATACYPGWEEHQGFCYKIYTKAANFTDAENTCMANGGHLVSIHGPTEQVFVRDHQKKLADGSILWLGMKILSSRPTWIDGTEFDYEKIGFDYRSNAGKCLQIHYQYGWVLQYCVSSYGFICKRKAGDDTPRSMGSAALTTWGWVKAQEISADDVNISYPLIVGMNTGELSANVTFTVETDFDYIPPNVTFSWVFGDGSLPVTEAFQPGNMNKSYVFTQRGTFNATLTIFVPGQAAVVFNLPVTVGVIQVDTESSSDWVILFITIDARGSNVSYVIDFDGSIDTCTISDVDKSLTLVEIKTATEGMPYTYRIFANNSVFEEQVAGQLLYLEAHSVTFVYPPAVGTVEITGSGSNSQWNNTNCKITFSDDSSVETTYTIPASFQHQYYQVGEISISAFCKTPTSSHTLHNTAIISNIITFGYGRPFLNQGVITKLSSEQITLTAWLDIRVFNLTSLFHWNVTHNGESFGITQPRSAVLATKPHHFYPGLYKVDFYASFEEYPELSMHDSVFLNILKPPLVAAIKGGTSRSVGSNQSVVVDAASLSYDPGVRSGQWEGLNFAWSCATATDLVTAEDMGARGTGRQCPECISSNVSGEITIDPPGCLGIETWHVLLVEVRKDSRKASTYQILEIIDVEDPTPHLELWCKVNCLERKNAEYSITLYSICVDCSEQDKQEARYEWKLHRRLSWEDPPEEVTNLEQLTTTGVHIDSVSIAPYGLPHGYIYQLLVRLSHLTGRSVGIVNQTFSMNYPPRGGNCGITPSIGRALDTQFELACFDWVDEGASHVQQTNDTADRLIYQFVLIQLNATSILYSGDSNVSPLMTLNQGDKAADYWIEISARILDPFNGMSQTKIMARVLPRFTEDGEVKDIQSISPILSQINSHMQQSVYEGEIQKTSRVVASASSALNSLILPASNSTTTDSPNTVNKDVHFEDLWTDLNKAKDTALQDKLKQETEGYIDALTNVLDKTAFVNMDTVYFSTSALNSVVQSEIVSEKGLEKATLAISTLTSQMDEIPTTDLSDTHVDEILNSVLVSVESTISATLPEQIVSPDDTVVQPEYGVELQEKERKFLMETLFQKQRYEAKPQRKLAEHVTKPLLTSVSKVLDVANKFLVHGQRPKTLTNHRLSATVQKRSLESFLEEGTETQGIAIKLGLNNRDPRENPVVTLKTTVFQKNPFVWDEDEASYFITSPAILMDLTSAEDGLPLPVTQQRTKNVTKQTVSVPNSPMPTITVKPRYIKEDFDQLLYHQIRLHSVDDAIVVFITSQMGTYDVYFRVGQYPTSTDYDYKVIVSPTITLGGHYQLKVIVPENTLRSPGDVYMGLKTYESELTKSRVKRDTVQNVSRADKYSDYQIAIGTVGCKTWNDDKWSGQDCAVSPSSTEEHTVCVCEKPLHQTFTLATSFYVPVNLIDFSTVFKKIDLTNNAGVFATIITLLLVYLILAVWAWHKDSSDFLKWGITPLVDNDPRDTCMYIVTVSTGMRQGAGTKSRVGIILSGEEETTDMRDLYDGVREEFPRNSEMNFLLATRFPLGDLLYIRLWHDNSGTGDSASWFPHEITVEDMQTDKRYTFRCDRWLAVDEGDGQLAATVPVSGKDDLVSFGHLFNENIRTQITDSHVWLSVALRPIRSHFNRLQRLSCCLSLLFLTMITSAMFYRTLENVVRPVIVSVGVLRFSLQQVYVSIISLLIVTPVNLAIVLLFKKSKPLSYTKSSILDRILSKCYPSRFRQQTKLKEIMIVQPTYSQREKMLPSWCVYVAWALLISSVTVSAFFLFLYSQEWGKTKSEEWLTSFVLSFLESLVFVDPIKVVVLTVFLSLVFRKPKRGLSVDIDKTEVSRTGQPAQRDTGFGFFSFFSTKHSKGPLSEEDIKKALIRRQAENRALGIVKEFFFFSIFLFVIFTIAYSNRDHRSYALRENVHKMLVKRQSDKRLGLENVSSREHFYRWMNETALPALFPENHYQGTNLNQLERFFVGDLQNYRVGPPRLRQVRSPEREPCLSPILDDFQCLKRYSLTNEESGDYCVGWTFKPCPDKQSVDKLTSDAWKFRSSLDIWGLPVWGQRNIYSGGGYISEMGINYKVSYLMLQEWLNYQWVDRQTRALSLEFTLYNPNVNIFCYVTLLVEFPEIGGALASAKVQPFRPYQHVGPLGAFIVFNEIIFLGYLVGGTLKLLFSIRKKGKKFFSSVWNVVDILIICTCYVSIAMFFARQLMVDTAIKRFRENAEVFVNFQHITEWDELLVTVMGVICFSCTIRMLKILAYNEHIHGISSILRRAGKDLIGVSIVFVIMFMGFVLPGYLLFGRNVTAYSTVPTTIATLFISMIGKSPFDEMRRSEPMIAQVYFAFFVFFNVFILLTMFLCILNEVIATLRKEEKEDASRFNIVNILVYKFKEYFGFCKESPT